MISCRMVCSEHLRTVFRLLKAASEPQKLQASPLAFLISNECFFAFEEFPRHLMMQTTLFIGPVDFYWTDSIWAARRVESCCVAFHASLVEGESFLIILEVLTNDTSKDDHSSILVIVIQSHSKQPVYNLENFGIQFGFKLETCNFSRKWLFLRAWQSPSTRDEHGRQLLGLILSMVSMGIIHMHTYLYLCTHMHIYHVLYIQYVIYISCPNLCCFVNQHRE